MSKITEYTSVTRFDANDILIKDGGAGTKTIKASDAAKEFAGLVSGSTALEEITGESFE